MMSVGQRIEWLLRLALLVFILCAAAFLSAVTAMRFAIQGRQVTMPNVVGKSSADAQAFLQFRGLQLKVVDRIYSELPANVVVRQSPPAGEPVKISQDAHVVLSLGRQDVTIPSLTGLSLRAARIQLLQAGLQLGEVTTYVAPTADPDIVKQQDPARGAKALSPRVNLLVVSGAPPPAYVMPWLVGMQRPDAERQLSAMGLKSPKVTDTPAAQWPKHTIVDQTPGQGTKVSSETSVELLVAE
jgi:eukaryotic-like serine/threonine-protein kinase